MTNLRDFVTLAILGGLALQIITHADQAIKIIDSVSGAFIDLFRTAAGKRPI